MAWLAVDKDGTETIFNLKPSKNDWRSSWENGKPYGNRINLTKGTIEKFIGKKLTWDDEPVEI